MAYDLTAELLPIKNRARGLLSAYQVGVGMDQAAHDSAEDVPRLLTVLEALVKAHQPITIYKDAGWCGCDPQPDGPGYEEWNGNHPYGTSLDLTESPRICLSSPMHEACPACSHLVYGHQGDEDCWVSPADCVALPIITTTFTGGVPSGASREEDTHDRSE